MTPDQMVALAKEHVDQAAEAGLTLRILGHLAVREHVVKHRDLIEALERVPTHDIDYMGYSKERDKADQMFKALGYEPDPAVVYSQEYGIKRLIYHDHDTGMMEEIFLDELDMAHKLDFRERLELDSPTISLVDLLLSKLQIQQINEKDIKDLIALTAEHNLGAGDRELIDIEYLLKLTRNDWGLYYTSRKNLGVVREFLGGYNVIGTALRESVEGKLIDILEQMEDVPKTMKWKMRARVGTKVKWYQDVSEVQDVHR